MEIPSQSAHQTIGVVVVTFQSADVILDCLSTLLGSTGVRLRVVVVDNASSDGTPDLVRRWADGSEAAPLHGLPFEAAPTPMPMALHADTASAMDDAGHAVALIETGGNLGFAGGVNRGLADLSADPAVDRFWVLNPDSVVPPGTARAFAEAEAPEAGFSLMGGRVLYLGDPGMIQIDGGTITRWSGITNNLGLYGDHATTPPSDPGRMDFITGASMVASRAFYEAVGPMREDYFLYYEEVDWALRRGDLPLAYCPGAIVYHQGGSAIGSPTPGRPPSAFALYFKNRARMMFVRRFLPGHVATAQAWSLAKAGQYALKGFRAEARALLAGAFGRPPPEAVTSRLSSDALERIWGLDAGR